MVRPIDISLNIQHAADMARVATADQQGRPEVAMQQFADRLEKQARQQNEQVQRQENTEKPTVNPDGRNPTGYAAKKKPPVKKKTDEKKKPPLTRTTGEHMYDIRI